jgi:hypothetical protein
LPPRLAGFVSLVGILACGAGPGVQANTARSNSKHYDDSTMCQERTMKNEQNDAVEQVIRAFDAAWARNDLEGVVSIFAEDAGLESPLVAPLLHRKEGVLRGRDEIREMVRALMRNGTPWGEHAPPLIRGNTVAIEFRRPPSDGGQFYSVDVIEIRESKIQTLRAYAGWRAVLAITDERRP